MRLKTFAAALVLGIGLAAAPQARAADQPIKLAISTVSLLYLPVYVADVNGYFKEQGLTPEITYFKTGGAGAFAAVLGGNLDIYVGAASSALRAIEQGTDTQVIASYMTQFSINTVIQGDIARKKGLTETSSEMDRLKALKGLNIGVTGAGSGTHQIIQYMMKRTGLDAERDATIAYAGGNDLMSGFVAKRLDGGTFSNPLSDIAVKQHGGYLLINGAAGQLSDLNGFLYIALITTKRWTDKNPEAAVKVVKASQKALTAINDPAISSQTRDKVHAKYFPEIDKVAFDSAWENLKPAFPATPKVERAHVEKVVNFLNEFSDEKYKLDFDKGFTNKYVDAAAR